MFGLSKEKMNPSKKFIVVLTGMICVVLFVTMAVIISCQSAFLTAEKIMRPFVGVSEYAYTKFHFVGYVKGRGPTWLFYYDSPDAFDAAPFAVEVNVWGGLRTVHTQRCGLWDEAEMKWNTTPRSGQ